MRQRTRAVRRPAVQHPAIMLMQMMLWSTMQQHIHVRADVHVAQLQCPRQGKNQWYVLLLRRLLANYLDMRWWTGRKPTGQGRVAVDVELEEVEEGVGDDGDGAVLLAFDAVVELKRLVGFLADGEGDPLDFVRFVFDVFAGFSAGGGELCQWLGMRSMGGVE